MKNANGSAIFVLAIILIAPHSANAQELLFVRTGISDIRTFLERCPTNDPAVGLIRQDFELRLDDVVITSPVTCTEPISSLPIDQLSDALIALQVLRTAYYMGIGTRGYLPWTEKGLYDWMKGNVAGINLKTAPGQLYCCDFINGKRYFSTSVQDATQREAKRTWPGIASSLNFFAHEIRHADTFSPGHTTGCPAFPLPTDPLGCDASYDLANLGSYGVQYWLESKWATGYLDIGIGCSPVAIARAYATYDASSANGFRARFVKDPPPLVTANEPYGGPCPQLPFSIVDRGGISSRSSGTSGTINIGYAGIQPNGDSTTPSGLALLRYRQNNILLTEVGVPASPLVQSGRIYAENTHGVNTAIAIANPNSEPTTVSFLFTDANGDFGTGSIDIPANGQTVKFLNEAPLNTPASFSGTLTFSAPLPVAVLALRKRMNERGEFLLTALPVADLSSPPSSSTMAFPQFADGGGWTTTLVLINPTDSPLVGTVHFLSPSGDGEDSLALAFNGQFGQTLTYSIPARGSQKLQTSGTGANSRNGSVRVIPGEGTSLPSGVAILSYRTHDITVSEASVLAVAAAPAFRVYAEASGDFGDRAMGSIQTGIAVTNLSAHVAPVTLELSQLDGSSTGLTGTLVLPSKGQTAVFLNEILGFGSLPKRFQGVLRVSSTVPISLVGLRGRYNERGEFLITTTPPTSETSPPSSVPLFFPLVVDSGGYTTQFILFSGHAGQASSGTIQFFSQTGNVWNATMQ